MASDAPEAGKEPSPLRPQGSTSAVRHKTMPIKGLGLNLALSSAPEPKLRRPNSQSKLSLSAGSLALANEQTNEDPDAAVALVELDLRSRLKINDKICSHIWEFLYLGSETVSANEELLKQVYHPGKFTYRCLWLLDGREEDVSCLFYDVIDFIETARQANGHVFIHCQQGVSRSSAMTIAYMMWRLGKGYAETHSEVKKRRNVSNPNAGFVVQLMNWHKRRQSLPDEKGRFYEVVRHSTGDRTFVPKALKLPVTGAHLRSSSCFLVEMPQTFYIWKGKQAEPESIAAAMHIVKQFQKYEIAPASVVDVSEDEESEEFWKVLGGRKLAAERVPPVYVHPPLPFNLDQARDFTAVRGDVTASAPASMTNLLAAMETTSASEPEGKKEKHDKKEKKEKKDKKKDKKQKKEKKAREGDSTPAASDPPGTVSADKR